MNKDEYLEYHERQRDRLLDYVRTASLIARVAPHQVVRDLVTDAYWILESDREAGKGVLSRSELKDRLKQIARERYAGNPVILVIVQILLPILVQLILEWWQSRLAEPKEENHGDQRRDD